MSKQRILELEEYKNAAFKQRKLCGQILFFNVPLVHGCKNLFELGYELLA